MRVDPSFLNPGTFLEQPRNDRSQAMTINIQELNRLSVVQERRESRTNDLKGEQFRAVLEAHKGERHIVVIQSFPDPDAISSALAHQMICERFGIVAEIAY